MKKLKKLMLAIAFMVFGIASVNAETVLKQITLDMTKLNNDDKILTSDLEGYKKNISGFKVYSSGTGYKCSNSDETYKDYSIQPDGKIVKLCGQQLQKDEENGKIYALYISADEHLIQSTEDKTTHQKVDTDIGAKMSSNAKWDFVKDPIEATKLYDKNVKTLYLIVKIPNSGDSQYLIMDAMGNKMVEVADTYKLIGATDYKFEQDNAIILKNNNEYVVVSANGVAERISSDVIKNGNENFFKSGGSYESIEVIAATSKMNYYVAKGNDGKYYIFTKNGYITSGGTPVAYSSVPNLENVGGEILYLSNGRYYKLDGTGFTSDEVKSQKIESNLIYNENDDKITISDGSKTILTTTKGALNLHNKLSLQYIGTVNDKYYFISVIPSGTTLADDDAVTKLYELTTDQAKNPDADGYKCQNVSGKYYDKDGNEVTEAEYKKSCEIVEPQKYSCDKVDGKFYDKAGNIVSEADFNKSCKSSEPTTPSNPSNPGSSETPKYSCEIKDGKYYSKDGSVVDKKTYESVCGLTDNPHTGIALPIILVVALAGIGAFVYKTKGKDLFKKI